MTGIEIRDGTIQVDASLLAKGLGLDPSHVPELLRRGDITSLCEQGIDEDEGRYRLSFFHAGRRLRIVTDAAGELLQFSSIDYGEQPLPSALRRPGA